jgi:superfamily II DNA or RNA helicase
MSATETSLPGMPRVVLQEIDLESIEDAVGVRTYGAGFREMQKGVVRRMEWVPGRSALHGVVQDKGGEFHETVVYFSGQPMRFGRGYCSCPVGCECKHAAALALAGAVSSGQDLEARPPSVPWEQSLSSLLQSPVPLPRHGGRPAAAPAAIGVELILAGASQYGAARHGGGVAASGSVMRPPLAVRARLVQPGASGSNWIAGQLSWSKVDTLQHLGRYPGPHLRLLRELYWTYQAAGRSQSYWPAAADRYLELTSFESRQLWPLLDEAESIGLPLVYGRGLGSLPRYGTAELVLDLTRPEPGGPLLISPVIGVDDTDHDIVPIRFIGTSGHGLVYVDRTEAGLAPDPSRWRFRLAKLLNAVPPQVQQVALAGQPLKVPPADQARFTEQFYPRLRHTASLLSSDGSVSLPSISAPTLVLAAEYGDEHQLDLRWEWAYQVGDSQHRALAADESADPARGPGGGAADSGYRDLEAERAILAGLDLAQGQLAPARLTGLDTMRFSTQTLPMLTGRPGVEVEVSGEPARYREAGDSVRVEVSAEDVPGENDWFGLEVQVFVENQRVPFKDLFLALSRGQQHLLLPGGAYFSLDKPGLQALARLIEEARALQDRPADNLRISKFQAGLWAELAELGLVTSQASRWQRQIDGLLSLAAGARDPEADGDDDAAAPADVLAAAAASDVPAGLTAQLRPYQLDGYRWLVFLWQHQLGGILADDMGLGKTLQCLALLCRAREGGSDAPPFLIVAPTSVVSNWAAEAARFAPGLRVVVITDTMARRKQDLAQLIAGADAVVTTYALLRIDFAAYSAPSWSGLILDEAQYTKNHQSKIYQCARRLDAPFKLALTGTPMENNLMELWSLLSITAPGLFPSPVKFQDYYARPIEKLGQSEKLDQLRRRVKPLMKRRTKEQVARDLPAKQEQVLEVELHPRHQKLYQTQLQRERQKVLRLIADVDANRFTILRSLTLLRQLSLHAGLVDPDHDDLPCAKLDALLDLLGDAVGGGHKALVFSQFTRFLDKARERLDEAGIDYCYLDGRTRDRPQVIERFTSGEVPVFLISLKAGGFGLNLTEADYCFLLDPWWNPATEAQAVDRAHRIGQTRNVVVYRLISKDTIEEKVMELKARKAALFSSVMDSGNAFGGGLSAEDIRGLFD